MTENREKERKVVYKGVLSVERTLKFEPSKKGNLRGKEHMNKK